LNIQEIAMPTAAAPAATAAPEEEPAEVSVLLMVFIYLFYVQINRLACIGEAQREDHIQCHARIL
jgi:hypothetical protein